MIGQTLAHYRITAKLGEGGMGEVWRARDTKLDRDVAIKLLPTAFGDDPERLARFEREAKLLASLNHPNIAAIYGMEESGGTRALVMELVEGPTLADRLEQGPFSFHECLSVSVQIAHALEEAHEKGIVHRDLKPQNIKASVEGKTKVLDFGLAKAMDPSAGTSGAGSGSASQLAQSPTLTLGATQMGVILGTAAYMAPEQAKGMAVDKRADIWAFGVVVFEMLSGARLFAGDSVPETLASVLRNEVDFGALPAATPPAMRRLLRRCLERNPKNRLHDIADARIVLEEIAAGRLDEMAAASAVAAVATVAPAPRSLSVRALPWIGGLVVGAALVALLGRGLLAPPPTEPPTFVSLTYSGTDTAPAGSPDGKSIAFASRRDGGSRIWLKQLATGEEVALTSGPDDGAPAFSPDGSSLLFARGPSPPFTIYRVAAVGGEPRRVVDDAATPASWSPDGRRLVFARSTVAGGVPEIVLTIAPDGGDEREVARSLDLAPIDLRWSPDGRSIGAWTQLRTNFAARQSIVEFDAESGERRTLYEPGTGTLIYGWDWSGPDAVVVAESRTQSGRGGSRLRLVSKGGGAPKSLVSLRQTSLSLDVIGPGRVAIDQQALESHLGDWPLALTGEVDIDRAPRVWRTRGASVDRQPVFSPDGRRLAFTSDRGGNLDIWQLELASGALHRLTVDGGDDWDPAFAPDGSKLLWSSNRSGNYEVWSAEADGGGARKATADGVDAENPGLTPDGRWMVYGSANPKQNGIWKIRPDGSGAERLVAGGMSVPELSSDGRWVAFVDLDRNRLRVVELEGGAPICEIELSTIPFSIVQAGRARWIPGSATLVWLDVDREAGSVPRLVAQEIVAGRDTSADRRVLLRGTRDAFPESFAISPDGATLVVAIAQPRSELLLIEGLPGVVP